MTAITIEHLTAKLSSLNASHLQIKDVSDGCGSSFEMLIVSEKFEKLRTLQRHQLVYACIPDELKILHALTLKTWTAKEFENQ